MKKFGIYSMAVLMLGIGTLSTGCMGSWGLTSALYKWNDGATGNKFIDNLLFWILGVVYGLTLTVDFLILNLVEFWTGSNPVAMQPGEIEKGIVKGKDGNSYEITVTQNRYDIVALTGKNKGEKSAVFYTPETKTWSSTKDGVTMPFATVHENTRKVELYCADGSVKLVDMNTMAAQSMVNAGF